MPMQFVSSFRAFAAKRCRLFLMAAPLLLILSGTDLYVDAEGRVTHNPAALERERQFFELRDRADGMRKTSGIAPEQTIAVYEQALTALGDRDEKLQVDVLRRMAETYADAAYAGARILGRVGEEALSASGGDVDAMLEAMQREFEAANKGRPNAFYVDKLIEQYKLVAAESAEIDPLLSARSLMEAARGASSIRDHDQAIELWDQALQAAQAHLASPSLDADEREEWEKVRLHANTAISNLEQIITTNTGVRGGGAGDAGASERSSSGAAARIGTDAAED